MTTPTNSPSPGYYVPQLDGLRYFAFLLVFLSHLPLADSLLIETPPLRGGAGGAAPFRLGRGRSVPGAERLSDHQFVAARTAALRAVFPQGFLYPPQSAHLAPLLSDDRHRVFHQSLVSGKWGSPEHLQMLQQHLGAYLAFLGNYSAGWFDYAESKYLAHLWTISLEEQFYLLWRLLLFLLIEKKRLLARMLWVLLGAAVYLRVCAWAAELPHPMAYAALPTRMDALALGSLLAGHLITVLVAAASYRYFEKPFLKLKGRFTHIASRPA